MTCMLCPRRATYLGVFIPRRPDKFGGRTHLTQLCDRCVRKGRPYWMARVEEVLAARAAASRN
jgi:hypothetical protein